MRRLGTVPRAGGGVRWVGFAGLGQTVTERLLREEEVTEPAGDEALALQLADVRHVMGGGCAAGGEYETAVGELASRLRALDWQVAARGRAPVSLAGWSHARWLAWTAHWWRGARGR